MNNLDRVPNIARLQQPRRQPIKMTLSPSKKPVMSNELDCEIEIALQQYAKQNIWKQWGCDSIRPQGAAVLLYGPPGCGKTTIANFMAKRVGKGIQHLNMKDVGGKAPGDTERKIAEVFLDCKNASNKTIFIDECESIIWDRSKAGSDSMWMVGVIDELLMQIAKYKGLIVMATNRESEIDTALASRCFAILQVGHPDRTCRYRLWMQKIPARFPLQLSIQQAHSLSILPLTGREIELALCREASWAISSGRDPEYITLKAQARKIVTANGIDWSDLLEDEDND